MTQEVQCNREGHPEGHKQVELVIYRWDKSGSRFKYGFARAACGCEVFICTPAILTDPKYWDENLKPGARLVADLLVERHPRLGTPCFKATNVEIIKEESYEL